MTLETQKKRAIELLYASESGDADTVNSHTNEDFVFQFMDSSASWSAEGQQVSTRLDKENFIKFGITAVKNVTTDGMHFKVNVVVAEGPYVVLFGQSNATSKTGKKYNNNYCWRFTFSGERISEFLEYCDTRHAYDVLFE